MAQFVCRVGTPDGSVAQRSVAAATPAAAREQLVGDGLTVFDVRPSRSGGLLGDRSASRVGTAGRRWFRRESTRIRHADLLLLNQELAALVRAGLPVLRCVDILRARRAGTVAGSALDRVRARIVSGESLSGAFRPEVAAAGVPELFVTSLEVGEASGDLVSALQRYGVHLGRTQALRSRVRAALVYPIVLIVVSVVVVGILLTLVIPRFANFYAAAGAELPVFTSLLVAAASFVGRYGLPLLAAGVAVAVGVTVWSRSAAGVERLDRLRLRLPIAGRLWHRYLALETTRTLATLLRGGSPLVRALRVTADGCRNGAFRGAILKAEARVTEGSSLHEALEEQGLLDDLGLEMVEVGESTGALEEMLEHVATTYDEELERQVGTAVGLMQPALLVTMGVLVAGILMSLYLPLFRTVQVVG